MRFFKFHKTSNFAHRLMLLGIVTLICSGCVANKRTASVSNGAPGPTDPDAATELSATDSGLKYRIMRKGNGNSPRATDTVTVNYRGWLDDGREFDSSYASGSPATFRLDEVVPGWTEGLQLVEEGGMIELEIPSQLGYGQGGIPGTIPANATLHFLVELIKVH